MEEDTNEEILLTPGQAAALFCVEVATVRDWANTGQLTVIKTLGGHRRYLRSEVERLLADGTDARADDGAKFGR